MRVLSICNDMVDYTDQQVDYTVISCIVAALWLIQPGESISCTLRDQTENNHVATHMTWICEKHLHGSISIHMPLFRSQASIIVQSN
jgi:hypothetical protein